MSRDALVVGINVYARLPNLKTPSEDTNAIARLLIEYGDFEVTPLPTVKNKDEDTPWIAQVGRTTHVTCSQLEDALIQLFLPTGRNVPDTALFFFSGHGLRREKGIQEGYLATSDVHPQAGHWGVSLQWLRRLLEESPVRQQIIWLDCCYSGELLNIEEADPGNRGFVRDRCFIAASREYEQAYEEKDGSHGILSKALLKGLDPGEQADGIVNNLTLTASINRTLKGSIQRALFTNFGGQILLTKSRTEREAHPTVISGICPYKGLAYFDYRGDDPKYFFGRTALTDQLIEKVRTSNFVAVLGASGSGKSSVVRAGLLYQLSQGQRLSGSEHWPIRIFRPGEHPFYNLASAFVDSGLSDVDRAIQLTTIAETIRTHGASELHNLVVENAAEQRLMLVADQFEEVFTLCQDETERQQFFECLLGILDFAAKTLCLIIVMRADFFSKCAEKEYAGLAQKIQENLTTIIPMTSEELEQAIREPAKQVGLEIEEELVQQMIDDVQNAPGHLPLLQYALTELWQQRDTECLKLASYIRIGGVKGTLTNHADEAYTFLSEEEQQVARRIFLDLTQLGEGTEDTRRQVNIQNLVTLQYTRVLVNQVIRKLADAKLVVTDEVIKKGEESGRVAVVDVAHEALIRYWPRLRKWIDENRNEIRFQRRLEDAARYWDNIRKPAGLLWRSPDLDLLRTFHQEHAHEMTPLQIEFFQKSVAAQEQEEVEKETIRQHEKEQRNRVLRTQSLFLTNLARQENQKHNYVKAIRLALVALPRTLKDPDRPYLTEAEIQLYKGIQALEQEVMPVCEYPVLDPAFNPEETLVVASWDNTAQVWEVATGREVARLTGHTDWITDAKFSFDGTQVVTASWDDTVRIWDARNGKIITVLVGHEDEVTHAVFSPDGTRVVTASKDNTARIWDVVTGQELAVLTGHTDWVAHVAFSFDNTRVVTSSWDDTARVWDANSGREIIMLSGHKSVVIYAAFSPDSMRVVTASWDNTARVWDLDSGREVIVLTGHAQRVTQVAFSSDNKYVFTASEDDTARIWRVFRNTQELINYANEIVPRRLTSEEKKQYFLDVEE